MKQKDKTWKLILIPLAIIAVLMLFLSLGMLIQSNVDRNIIDGYKNLAVEAINQTAETEELLELSVKMVDYCVNQYTVGTFTEFTSEYVRYEVNKMLEEQDY